MARVPVTLAVFSFLARLVRALSFLEGRCMAKEEDLATAAAVAGVAKSAPPVVVSGMTLAGYSLND